MPRGGMPRTALAALRGLFCSTYIKTSAHANKCARPETTERPKCPSQWYRFQTPSTLKPSSDATRPLSSKVSPACAGFALAPLHASNPMTDRYLQHMCGRVVCTGGKNKIGCAERNLNFLWPHHPFIDFDIKICTYLPGATGLGLMHVRLCVFGRWLQSTNCRRTIKSGFDRFRRPTSILAMATMRLPGQTRPACGMSIWAWLQ